MKHSKYHVITNNTSCMLLVILFIVLINCEYKSARKLQIGIKKRPENCTQKSKKGDFLRIYYKGHLEDGTVFDSNISEKKPFAFTLGAGEVIKGWDQGLIGMCVGEQRKLVVPPDLAYGASNMNNVIPPNATLTFHIELISIEFREDL